MIEMTSLRNYPSSAPIAVHPIHSRLGVKPQLTSAELQCNSLYMSVQQEYPEVLEYEGIDAYFLVVQLGGQAQLTLNSGAKKIKRRSSAGACSLFVKNESFSVDIGDEHKTAHIYLRSELIERVIEERVAAGARRAKVEPFFGISEPLLEQLALNCVRAIRQRDPSNAMYVDHLAWALAAHLVEAHTDRVAEAGELSGLSIRQFRRVEAYVQEHLSENIRVSDLASAACLSPIYFCQQFKLMKGIPPFRYVRLARIERAKQLLAADEMPLAEVALECGFCHQEHLTSTFKTECGTSPAMYRRFHRQRHLDSGRTSQGASQYKRT